MTILASPGITHPLLVERFARRCVPGPPDECWRWQGNHRSDGYGRLKIGEQEWVAHRLAYQLAGYVIPDGFHVDHLCNVRDCCNPTHLEAVPVGVNTSRGGPTRGVRRVQCSNGHLTTVENTRRNNDGSLTCLTCHNEWRRRKRAGAKVTP